MPLRGSSERVALGKAHCQPQGARRCRVLHGQCVGQPHLAVAGLQIARVQCARLGKLLLKRRKQVLRQHRDAVLAALAVADQQLAALELDVLDAQAQPFKQANAGAVQE